MGDCFFLSQDELQTYLNNGYVQLGGPFNSQNDCVANCGGSSSQAQSSSQGQSSSSSAAANVPICCPNGIPQNLHATYTDAGGCACMNGLSVAISYNGSVWTGSTTGCGHTITVILTPMGGCSFQIQAKCDATFFVSQSSFSVTCTPSVNMQFSTGFVFPACGTCNGSVTVVVTI